MIALDGGLQEEPMNEHSAISIFEVHQIRAATRRHGCFA